MTNQQSEFDFDTSIERAESAIHSINLLYKDSIGAINALRHQSKIYMDYISDVDRGLELQNKDADDEEDYIAALTKLINKFNQEIVEQVHTFNENFESIIKYYHAAVEKFEGKSGQLTSLLEGRKKLMFLNAVVKKIKLKVMSLQQMNNILFAFTQSLKDEKLVYKHNLVLLNTQMARASDLSFELIKKIEEIN